MKIIFRCDAKLINEEINATQLAKLAVQIHGGGWTSESTLAAIEWQSHVIKSGEPVEFKLGDDTYTVQVMQ